MSTDLGLHPLVAHLPGMIYRCRYDAFWTMEYLSEACYALTGYCASALIHNRELSYLDLIYPQDRQQVAQEISQSLLENRAWTLEYRIQDAQGRIRWVWEQGIGIYQENELIALEGFIADISERRQREEALHQQISSTEAELRHQNTLLNEYKKAFDQSAIISKTDTHGIITYVNEEFCKVSGYSREELIGESHSITGHPDNPVGLYQEIWQSIRHKNIWQGIIKNRHKQGRAYFVKTSIVPILDSQGHIIEYMAIRHDVTDLIEKEIKIQQQITDELTGLPNRLQLMEDISHSNQTQLALMNIDRFKEINECYGYQQGDLLLKELGGLLGAHFSYAKVYRIHADLFAILDINRAYTETWISKLEGWLTTIEDMSFGHPDESFTLSMTVGVSLEQTNLYLNAETALCRAKEQRRNLLIYDQGINLKQQHIHNLEWTKRLRSAFQDERILVFAQPIICNQSAKIHKYECLVRYQSPEGQIITPFQFLDVAKKSRLYPKITRTVIEQACRYFSQRDEEFSINISLQDVLDHELTDRLFAWISEYAVANRLILELVESEGIENFREVNRFIDKVRAYGCRIAIDDFGTGYSNFEYLLKLKMDMIKIDGSLIRHIDKDQNARQVTQVIVDFAQRLGVQTVAEFVHSAEVHASVCELAIDYSQGYYLGEPQPLDALLIQNEK